MLQQNLTNASLPHIFSLHCYNTYSQLSWLDYFTPEEATTSVPSCTPASLSTGPWATLDFKDTRTGQAEAGEAQAQHGLVLQESPAAVRCSAAQRVQAAHALHSSKACANFVLADAPS